jgi:glycosyltransferase involved in cell wall biosynthesis
VAWTAVSELAARPLHAIVGPRGEVGVLPNGVEPLDWTVLPLPRDPHDVVVVSVMRLEARKRPMALLRAVRRALRSLPAGVRLRVVVVGDGPLRPRLERAVRRLGLEDVVDLPGRMTRAGIRDLYRRADVYVAPATLESFGIAALEAHAAGLPVVGRRGTGLSDFIRDGEGGVLVGSDRELAGVLTRMATERTHESVPRSSSLDSFSWPAVVERHRALYLEAGAANAGARVARAS